MNSNPALYRELNLPFDDEESLKSALDAFLVMVSDFRIECKLPDVHILIRTSHYDADGVETDTISDLYFGNQAQALAVARHGYVNAMQPYLIDEADLGIGEE